jgi:hypothetical protein
LRRALSLIAFSGIFFGAAAACLRPAEAATKTVHVYVALADNKHQGIIPVPARLGNGQDPANNLYWGAAFGVRTFFRSRPGWKTLSCGTGPQVTVLERCIFEHRSSGARLIADAYDGARIRDAVTDFLAAATGGHADLVAYVGHDAFMDFQLPRPAKPANVNTRQFIVLACASRAYFRPYMEDTGSQPLLWTTGLMAPEAYTLDAAMESWLGGGDSEAVRMRAAEAYNRYQKCGLRAAQRLFVSSW